VPLGRDGAAVHGQSTKGIARTRERESPCSDLGEACGNGVVGGVIEALDLACERRVSVVVPDGEGAGGSGAVQDHSTSREACHRTAKAVEVEKRGCCRQIQLG
jgi:hypothetical protein